MRFQRVKCITIAQFAASFVILALLCSWCSQTAQADARWQDSSPTATETPPFTVPSPYDLIAEINLMRESYGLAPLAIHPALMQVAQEEANGIAAGMPGHWRPYGLTLGQWLIMNGYPLSGDLTLDGYRSENWSTAPNAQGAIEQVHYWVSSNDEEHTNTMLSIYRSDIGAGVAAFKDEWGNDQVIFVIETALQTKSGQQQSIARDFLTQVPSLISGASSINGTPIALSEGQYIIPVSLSTALPNGDVYHQVRSGQALWSIAIYYDTTIAEIRKLNNLGSENTIYEGQKLLVKKGATQPAPANSTPSVPPAISATPLPVRPTQTATPTPTITPESATILDKKDAPIVLGAILFAFVVLVVVFASSLKVKN